MGKLSRRELSRFAGASLACRMASACLPEGELKRPMQLQPALLADGWEIARPEDVDLDPAGVRAAYERVFHPDLYINALSLLVVRRGKLVAEGYVQRASDIARREHIQSMTKSLTSLAFGVLRGQGHFPDLDASIADFLLVEDAAKHAITLRHLLTMRSGIDIDNERFGMELLMAERAHMTRWILEQPLASIPGERFDYRDCDPQLIGSIVLAVTGRSVESVVREHVFGPLGIQDVRWLHNVDGEPLTAHGVWLRPRDVARLGELVRNRGSLHGEALVPAAWLEDATSHQTATRGDEHHRGYGYGYYFWTVPELAAHSAWGHGGNFMFVVPDAELTLVLTSMPDAGSAIASELSDVAALAELILA